MSKIVAILFWACFVVHVAPTAAQNAPVEAEFYVTGDKALRITDGKGGEVTVGHDPHVNTMARELSIRRADMGYPTDLWIVMDVYEDDRIEFEVTGRSTDWGGISVFGDDMGCDYAIDTIIGEGRVVSFGLDKENCLLEREIDLQYVRTDLELMPQLDWMTEEAASRYRVEADQLYGAIGDSNWSGARRSLGRMRTWAEADTNLNAKHLMRDLLRDIERTLPKDYLAPLAGALVLDTEALASGTLVSNGFRIDGRDHDLAGLPTDSAAVHGIATTEPIRAFALANIPPGRLGNITGSSPAPDIAVAEPGLDLALLAAEALYHPDLVTVSGTAPAVLGAESVPVVAYAPGRLDLPAGHRGYGLLIADEAVNLADGAEWRGLILVRGAKPELRVHGTGMVLGGAALTGGPADLRLYDEAAVLRSAAALGLAQAALDAAP